VDERAHGDADVGPRDEVLRDAEGAVAEEDGHAEVHDEFDGVGTNAREDGEGDDGGEGRDDRDAEEDFSDVVDDFVEDADAVAFDGRTDGRRGGWNGWKVRDGAVGHVD